ncbi:hypothetical protein Leryth_013627, partial [Lithospermum erythrorhizon]
MTVVEYSVYFKKKKTQTNILSKGSICLGLNSSSCSNFIVGSRKTFSRVGLLARIMR